MGHGIFLDIDQSLQGNTHMGYSLTLTSLYRAIHTWDDSLTLTSLYRAIHTWDDSLTLTSLYRAIHTWDDSLTLTSLYRAKHRFLDIDQSLLGNTHMG
ncbi:hypothetical protein DPMN_082928 [Dreissena polymorpha]|uniref:Uncharacterized protein n=1 Tax=Dreissena polymorpha TaxID=45954 RepID=A0A9D4BJA9_DREPO|nr:hypothetical protein DPMN_082928 [Dreissena polymorpha]